MKILLKLMLGASLIFLSSCSDDDSSGNTIINGADSGATIRAQQIIQNDINSTTSDGALIVDLRYSDGSDNTLLETLNVYVTFFDNSEGQGDSAGSLERTEVLLRSVPNTEFGVDDNDLPSYTLTISLEDFLSATNNTATGIAVPDVFNTRLELELTDGRVFSTNNTADLGVGEATFSFITRVE